MTIAAVNEARAQASSSDFIFERSHEVPSTPTQLEGLTKERLRLARNEIFARHGYIFSSTDLRASFAARPWYRPTTNDISGLRLSAIEQANVALIKRFEEQAPTEPTASSPKPVSPPLVVANNPPPPNAVQLQRPEHRLYHPGDYCRPQCR
nr:YARHG domain-containing protein [Azospirillum doebereinerae]